MYILPDSSSRQSSPNNDALSGLFLPSATTPTSYLINGCGVFLDTKHVIPYKSCLDTPTARVARHTGNNQLDYGGGLFLFGCLIVIEHSTTAFPGSERPPFPLLRDVFTSGVAQCNESLMRSKYLGQADPVSARPSTFELATTCHGDCRSRQFSLPPPFKST